MAAGRKTAELASEPWQIGHGRTLCEEKVWPSLEFPANLCRAFHNVRLSITGLGLNRYAVYVARRSVDFGSDAPAALLAHWLRPLPV
jgi:hypothetical protein